MSLKSKGDSLLKSVSDSLAPSAPTPVSRRALPSSKQPGTAVGMMVGNANESLRTRLADAESRAEELEKAHAEQIAKIQILEKATPVQMLDPARVRRSRYADRHPNAYEDPAFHELCDLIKETGGNTEEAKVRPVVGEADYDYELASGHRRHAACLRLGLPFRAIVVPYSDGELLRQMHAENTGREGLSAFELGRHYSLLLADQMFVSGRDLAAKLGTSQSVVQRLLKFAELPEEIITAFSDPREIRGQWIDPLVQAWKSDRVRIQTEIRGIQNQSALRSSEVYRRLAGVSSKKMVITSQGSVVGRIRMVHGCPAVVLYKGAPNELLEQIQQLVVSWSAEHGDGS